MNVRATHVRGRSFGSFAEVAFSLLPAAIPLPRGSLALKVVFKVFALVLVGGMGCQKHTTTSGAPPVVKATANSIVINQPFDQVWSRFIPTVSKKFFEIDIVDKNSGIVSVSFHADPEEYVDCGTLHVRSGAHKTDFPVARAHQAWAVEEPRMMVQYQAQTVTLNGKMHIVFERLSETSTKVTVDIRYVLNRSVTAQYYQKGGPTPTSTQETLTFDSGGEGTFGSKWPVPRTWKGASAAVEREIRRLNAETNRIKSGGGDTDNEGENEIEAHSRTEDRGADGTYFSAGGWVCRPNGKFEHSILAMIQ